MPPGPAKGLALALCECWRHQKVTFSILLCEKVLNNILVVRGLALKTEMVTSFERKAQKNKNPVQQVPKKFCHIVFCWRRDEKAFFVLTTADIVVDALVNLFFALETEKGILLERKALANFSRSGDTEVCCA